MQSSQFLFPPPKFKNTTVGAMLHRSDPSAPEQSSFGTSPILEIDLLSVTTDPAARLSLKIKIKKMERTGNIPPESTHVPIAVPGASGDPRGPMRRRAINPPVKYSPPPFNIPQTRQRLSKNGKLNEQPNAQRQLPPRDSTLADQVEPPSLAQGQINLNPVNPTDHSVPADDITDSGDSGHSGDSDSDDSVCSTCGNSTHGSPSPIPKTPPPPFVPRWKRPPPKLSAKAARAEVEKSKLAEQHFLEVLGYVSDSDSSDDEYTDDRGASEVVPPEHHGASEIPSNNHNASEIPLLHAQSHSNGHNDDRHPLDVAPMRNYWRQNGHRHFPHIGLQDLLVYAGVLQEEAGSESETEREATKFVRPVYDRGLHPHGERIASGGLDDGGGYLQFPTSSPNAFSTNSDFLPTANTSLVPPAHAPWASLTHKKSLVVPNPYSHNADVTAFLSSSTYPPSLLTAGSSMPNRQTDDGSSSYSIPSFEQPDNTSYHDVDPLPWMYANVGSPEIGETGGGDYLASEMHFNEPGFSFGDFDVYYDAFDARESVEYGSYGPGALSEGDGSGGVGAG